MECVKKISSVPTDVNERPRIPVYITDCGLDLDSDSEQSDQEQVIEEIKDEKPISNRKAELMMRVNQALKSNNKAVIDE
jgi:hypothetical protein